MSTGVSHRCEHHLLCVVAEEVEIVVLCEWEGEVSPITVGPPTVFAIGNHPQDSDQAATHTINWPTDKLPMLFPGHKGGWS